MHVALTMPTDLRAPGAIEDLLAFHRQTFGDARMEEGAAGTEGAPAADDKTFTQADIDRVVAERIARTERKYAGHDELKAKAEQFDALQAASASDLDKAVGTARKEVETALRAEFAAERVADKIEVAAAGKFADIEDAKLHLGPKALEFIKDGVVDTEAVAKAVEALLAAKPHLAAPAAPTKVPSPAAVGLGVTGDAKPDGNVSPGLGRIAAAYAASSAK